MHNGEVGNQHLLISDWIAKYSVCDRLAAMAVNETLQRIALGS